MPNKQEICNWSLSHLGITQFIANIDTDKTNEAIVCRRWYDIAVKYALEDYDWNFARRRRALALLTITPPSIWGYAYAYPADCAKPRWIDPGIRTPTAAQRIPFESAGENGTGSNKDYRVIYTDQPNAVLVYTKNITDAGLFDAQFSVGVSLLLATYTAMGLSVKPEYAERAAAKYLGVKIAGIAVQLNEGQEDQEPETDAITARNG